MPLPDVAVPATAPLLGSELKSAAVRFVASLGGLIAISLLLASF